MPPRAPKHSRSPADAGRNRQSNVESEALLSERFWRSAGWIGGVPLLVLLGAIASGWRPQPWWTAQPQTLEQPPSALPTYPTAAEPDPLFFPSPSDSLAPPPLLGPFSSPKAGLSQLGNEVSPPPIGVDGANTKISNAGVSRLPAISVGGAGSSVALPSPRVIASPVPRAPSASAPLQPGGVLLMQSPLPPHPLAIALDRLSRSNPPPTTASPNPAALTQAQTASQGSRPTLPSSAPRPSGYSTPITPTGTPDYTPPPELQRSGATAPAAAGTLIPQTTPTQIVEFDSLPQSNPLPESSSPTGTTEQRPFSATGQGIGGGEIGTFSNPGVVEERFRRNP